MGAFSVPVFADWLVTFAIHSTCALGMAAALSLVMRRRWLVWQERMLRFSLWVALLSSSLQVAFATTPLSLSLRPDLAAVEPVSIAGELPSPADLAAIPGPALATSAPGWWSSAEVLASIALGLALLGGLWLLRTYGRLRRVLRNREPETDGRCLAIAADVARSLGLRQSPHVSRSQQILTPIAFGCLRPEICLPVRAASLDDEALRAMLAHEVAHLRRLDPAWMWLVAGLNALFPWQPLLALVRRRWSHLVELRCDAIAAGQTSPTAVARCLLDVAGWLRPGQQVPTVALGMAARPSALRRRVEAALHEAAAGRVNRPLSVAFSGLSLATLTFAAPGVDSTPMASGPEPAAITLPVEIRPAGGSMSAASLRVTVTQLEGERAALLDELDRLRREVRQSPLRPELDPLLALLERSLDGVQSQLQRLHALIDRRAARESLLKSR
ncbi:MAG: hypothetical protein KDC98_20090 [Planctomycetes bacterium]|nr:hypothetical protein [Planctomycetota bacterium]